MAKTSLTLGIVAETMKGETRVAVAPQDISRFAGLSENLNIVTEKGAGKTAGFADKMYDELALKL